MRFDATTTSPADRRARRAAKLLVIAGSASLIVTWLLARWKGREGGWGMPRFTLLPRPVWMSPGGGFGFTSTTGQPEPGPADTTEAGSVEVAEDAGGLPAYMPGTGGWGRGAGGSTSPTS